MIESIGLKIKVHVQASIYSLDVWSCKYTIEQYVLPMLVECLSNKL